MNQPVAIVTGASRGIGRAIAIRLGKAGYHVVGIYKSDAKAAESLLDNGIEMYQADVGNEADVAKAIDYVAKKFKRIDVLVNNAAINMSGSVEMLSTSDWHLIRQQFPDRKVVG